MFEKPILPLVTIVAMPIKINRLAILIRSRYRQSFLSPSTTFIASWTRPSKANRTAVKASPHWRQ
jgi:hypothetical protein